MSDEITIEIWYEEKRNLWMTKSLGTTSPRNTRTMTVLDFYVESITSEKLAVTKKQIKIIRRATLGEQRNAANDTVDKLRMFESAGIIGCHDNTIPVKLFSPFGTHVIFMNNVRQNKNAGEFTNSTVDQKQKLPKKLVRSGQKQWKPVSVLHISQYEKLNWASVVEQTDLPWQQRIPRDKIERIKKPAIYTENKENAKRKYRENVGTVEKAKPPVFPKNESKTIQKENIGECGKFAGNENSPRLLKQEVDIDGEDVIDSTPKSPRQLNKTFRHNGAAHPMAALFTQQMAAVVEKTNTSPPPQKSGPEYKIEKDNIVLHFNSPVVSKKQIDIEKENHELNSSLTKEGSTLPQNTPIIEEIAERSASPLLPGRKMVSIFDKNDSKEIRKSRTLDRHDSKDQKKKIWFAKSDHKLKTSVDSDLSTSTTTEQKSKFKKQHRKSKSVMVQPTYLSSNPEENKTTKDVNKIPNRKNSIGSSQKETKPEKLSLFKRIYSSPQTEKKLDINDLSLTKRTRRHTQPVGCIQKEFIRELKGKLDKYSSENPVKGEEANEKVVWNINI